LVPRDDLLHGILVYLKFFHDMKLESGGFVIEIEPSDYNKSRIFQRDAGKVFSH